MAPVFFIPIFLHEKDFDRVLSLILFILLTTLILYFSIKFHLKIKRMIEESQ